MSFLLPKDVITVINTLQNNGHEAFIVGGCVRDTLLNKTPLDYDITTSASPQEIKALFNKTVDTGIKHGTVTVIINNNCFEVTTYRTDGSYTNNRKPDNVTFVKNIKEDLIRRDFTINAMAYNDTKGLVDLVGGKKDLQNGILRAVGESEKRFSEDALRILRLFRFSATLNFCIEDDTLNGALKCSDNLKSISRERIREELFKIFLSNYPLRAQPLLDFGALDFLGIKKADLSLLSNYQADLYLRFAAFCKISGSNALSLCKELKCDNNLKKYCQNIFGVLENMPNTKAQIKQSMRDFGVKPTADALSLCQKDNAVVQEIQNNNEPFLICQLTISGEDLLNLGFKGNEIGKILLMLSNEVCKRPDLNNKEALLKIINNIN